MENNMNDDQKKEFLLSHHKPELVAYVMVYEVWEDGEITLTKGGELYRQRTLHCIEPGNPNKAWPIELFPVNNGSHGYVITDLNGAEAVRAAILG
jgi:hypothetical protein